MDFLLVANYKFLVGRSEFTSWYKQHIWVVGSYLNLGGPLVMCCATAAAFYSAKTWVGKLPTLSISHLHPCIIGDKIS